MEVVNSLSSHVGSIDKEKCQPKLTLCQMLLLNSVVCGIEICACAGFTYIPPLLLKSGFSEENMSMVLGCGPLLSLFIAPIIGRASDRCYSPYGRRRPFILLFSTILIFSMYLIPFGESIVVTFLGKGDLSKTLAVVFLTVGSVMLDFTSQTCLTPCEALLNDASKKTGQQDRIFSIYSLMVSLGGIIGYLLSAINWKSNSIGTFFGGEEASVFSILILIFSVMLTATLTVASETPLEKNMDAYDNLSGRFDSIDNTQLTIPLTQESGYESSNSSRSVSEENLHNISLLKDTNFSVSFPPSKPLVPLLPYENCVSYFTSKTNFLCQNRQLRQNCGSMILHLLPNTVKQMFNVPFVLRQLIYAAFFSWTAVMAFNLYFTDFVGQIVYHGNPNAEIESESSNLYDDGVRMGSWGLLLHCITSATYSVFVEKMVDRYGCKMTYMMGMTSFSFAMTGMVLVPNVIVVILMAGLTGFAFATLTTIPFILVSRYHEDKELYFFDVITTTPVGNNGIGTYIATLDSAYFLSQVILASCAGYIVRLTGTVTSYMVTAGFMGILSIVFINRIIISKQDLIQLCNERKSEGVV